MIFAFCLISKIGYCQIFAPQFFLGNKSAEHSIMLAKNLDEKGKFSLFNYSFFNVNYNDIQLNTSEIYQIGIYNFSKAFGVAAGGRYRDKDFLPQIAFSYQIVKENLYINLFPAIQYSTVSKEVQYGLFGLVIYTPKINDKWNMFNQLMIEPLFNKNSHILSYQQFRVGLDYNNKLQFGVATNLDQFGRDFNFNSNLGLFIRTDFH
jgi:hypothetical protein